MSRIATVNYGSATDTQFQWATTDGDLFDRELDLFRLAQAVEGHDHSAAKGLAVARVAANSVPTAAIQALAVTEDRINTGAVTNAKLGAGAVTYGKITFPLTQSANNFAGGLTVRDTGATYAGGFYIAANGLLVFGSGVSGGVIGTNLILGQAGQVSVGTVQGGGKFNVMQASEGPGQGVRVYHSNQSNVGDFFLDASARVVIGAGGNSFVHINPSTGRVAISSVAYDDARLALKQNSDVLEEGFRIINAAGGGLFYAYVKTNGDAVLRSQNTQTVLEHASASFSPEVNGGAGLGRSGLAWGAAFVAALTATTGTFSGAVSMAALTATTGTFSGAVSMTGLTATTGTFSGAVSMTALTATNGVFSGFVQAAVGFVALTTSTMQSIVPSADNTYVLGTAGTKWLNIVVQDGYKPGGGSWTATSDDRTKMTTKFRPYDRGLKEILALQPVYYTYNGDYNTPRGQEYVGLSAQATQKIAPDLVGSIKLAKKSGDIEEDVLTINPSNLTYMLILAVQELAARIKDLEARRN